MKMRLVLEVRKLTKGMTYNVRFSHPGQGFTLYYLACKQTSALA
jgi:hypothetical protein